MAIDEFELRIRYISQLQLNILQMVLKYTKSILSDTHKNNNKNTNNNFAKNIENTIKCNNDIYQYKIPIIRDLRH